MNQARNLIKTQDTLHMDIETQSSINLTTAGLYAYASAEDFKVILLGISVNGDPVESYDLTKEALPARIIDMLKDPKVIKSAYNAVFERVCLSKHLGIYLSPQSWRCSMVHALYLGISGSLDQVGTLLNIDKKKLSTGKDLIRKFCVPRKPTKNNPNTWINPEDDPEAWARFKEYNKRDVEADMEIAEKLSRFPVPDEVWKQYELDQLINDRGVGIDHILVQKAIDCDSQSRDSHMAQAKELTGLDNPNSPVQLRQWFMANGLQIPSLAKADIEEAISQAEGNVLKVLKLRQVLSKSSVKKYTKMLDCLCPDGRAHGLLQFYGAARTGRWAGRLIQVQNLPQNHMLELDEARALVASGDYEAIDFFYDSVPDMLSELIRTAFIAKDGCKFIVCDYSQIEARCLAWLAGERWRMEMFARGDDLYCASASQMFGVNVEKNGENAHLRQKGKIAELALGYGGGTGAMLGMGAVRMGIPEEDLQGIVDAWRHANPAIVRMWRDINNASLTCVKDKKPMQYKNLMFSYESGFMFIRLPSGRRLAYPKPIIMQNDRGWPELTYEGEEKNKWTRIKTYGAKLCENIIQAIARDILADAMIRLEAADYPIVMHVHDEVVLEAPMEANVENVERVMSEVPEWANGLILAAAGYECPYYKKE